MFYSCGDLKKIYLPHREPIRHESKGTNIVQLGKPMTLLELHTEGLARGLVVNSPLDYSNGAIITNISCQIGKTLIEVGILDLFIPIASWIVLDYLLLSSPKCIYNHVEWETPNNTSWIVMAIDCLHKLTIRPCCWRQHLYNWLNTEKSSCSLP